MTDPRPLLPAFLLEPGANALCAEVDPEVFFPEQGQSNEPAKSVCNKCDLRDPCLAWALQREVGGIWGGSSQYERRRLRGQKPAGRPVEPIKHGEVAGYKAHKRRDEDACEPCLAALRRANAERARNRRRRGAA